MRFSKIHFTLNLFFTFVFLFPSYSFSAVTGVCDWTACNFMYIKNISTYTGTNRHFPTDVSILGCDVVFNYRSTVISRQTVHRYQLYNVVWSSTQNSFISDTRIEGTSMNIVPESDIPELLAFYRALGIPSTVSEISANVNAGCSGGCPIDSAVSACGGSSENIAFFNDETCDFTCLDCESIASDCSGSCLPLNVSSFGCVEDSNGFIEITEDCTCYDSSCSELENDCSNECSGFYISNCQQDSNNNVVSNTCECDSCSLEAETFGNENCNGSDYIESYNCDTHIGTCIPYGCNDSLEDCLQECNGFAEVHTCTGENDDLTRVCICEGDFDVDFTGDPDVSESNTDQTQVSSENDTEIQSLLKAVNNTADISKNTKAIDDTLNRELNLLNATAESIEKNLNSGFELKGEVNLINDNVYNTDVIQPVENSLSASISSYLDAGLPLQTFIKGSGFTVSNIDPVLTCVLWNNEEVNFDISPMESTLNWMGLIVFALSTISAFMIVVKR